MNVHQRSKELARQQVDLDYFERKRRQALAEFYEGSIGLKMLSDQYLRMAREMKEAGII